MDCAEGTVAGLGARVDLAQQDGCQQLKYLIHCIWDL